MKSIILPNAKNIFHSMNFAFERIVDDVTTKVEKKAQNFELLSKISFPEIQRMIESCNEICTQFVPGVKFALSNESASFMWQHRMRVMCNLPPHSHHPAHPPKREMGETQTNCGEPSQTDGEDECTQLTNKTDTTVISLSICEFVKFHDKFFMTYKMRETVLMREQREKQNDTTHAGNVENLEKAVKKLDEDDDSMLCPICFDAHSNVVLHCGHEFCESCINNWICNHSSFRLPDTLHEELSHWLYRRGCIDIYNRRIHREYLRQQRASQTEFGAANQNANQNRGGAYMRQYETAIADDGFIMITRADFHSSSGSPDPYRTPPLDSPLQSYLHSSALATSNTVSNSNAMATTSAAEELPNCPICRAPQPIRLHRASNTWMFFQSPSSSATAFLASSSSHHHCTLNSATENLRDCTIPSVEQCADQMNEVLKSLIRDLNN